MNAAKCHTLLCINILSEIFFENWHIFHAYCLKVFKRVLIISELYKITKKSVVSCKIFAEIFA